MATVPASNDMTIGGSHGLSHCETCNEHLEGTIAQLEHYFAEPHISRVAEIIAGLRNGSLRQQPSSRGVGYNLGEHTVV